MSTERDIEPSPAVTRPTNALLLHNDDLTPISMARNHYSIFVESNVNRRLNQAPSQVLCPKQDRRSHVRTITFQLHDQVLTHIGVDEMRSPTSSHTSLQVKHECLSTRTPDVRVHEPSPAAAGLDQDHLSTSSEVKLEEPNQLGFIHTPPQSQDRYNYNHTATPQDHDSISHIPGLGADQNPSSPSAKAQDPHIHPTITPPEPSNLHNTEPDTSEAPHPHQRLRKIGDRALTMVQDACGVVHDVLDGL